MKVIRTNGGKELRLVEGHLFVFVDGKAVAYFMPFGRADVVANWWCHYSGDEFFFAISDIRDNFPEGANNCQTRIRWAHMDYVESLMLGPPPKREKAAIWRDQEERRRERLRKEPNSQWAIDFRKRKAERARRSKAKKAQENAATSQKVSVCPSP